MICITTTNSNIISYPKFLGKAKFSSQLLVVIITREIAHESFRSLSPPHRSHPCECHLVSSSRATLFGSERVMQMHRTRNK